MGTEGRMRGTEIKNHTSDAEKIHGPITAIPMSLRGGGDRSIKDAPVIGRSCGCFRYAGGSQRQRIGGGHNRFQGKVEDGRWQHG
jgi:hypothetical protein